jgi:hypothetical protein
VGATQTDARTTKIIEEMGRPKMAHKEREEKQRDRRKVSAGSGYQIFEPQGICCNDEGEAQGETPGQAVLEAARKHYEKDQAFPLVARYGFEDDNMPGWKMTPMSGHHGAEGRVIWTRRVTNIL